MGEPKLRWNLIAGPKTAYPFVLHSFTARGRLKAERKALRRLTARYGNLVAHGLLDVTLEQAR